MKRNLRNSLVTSGGAIHATHRVSTLLGFEDRVIHSFPNGARGKESA